MRMVSTGVAKNAAAMLMMALALAAATARAAVGSWRAYMAYHDVQQIREAGGHLFVLASNGLYQYNMADQSITTYDKVNGLSDTYMTNIEWCNAARRLIAVYSNSNIDLVATDGTVTNIPDLYSKSMTEDKTVNSITVSGNDAYLATNFGVVRVDMANAVISETYNLGLQVNRVAVSGGSVYVQAAGGDVLAGSLSSNLLDRGNWSEVADIPPGLFDEDNSAYEKYHELVETLDPGGPDYNYMGFVMFKNGRLYTEQPFVMEVPASRIREDCPEQEKILVQGMIDAYFEEADGLVIVDYKTDRVPGRDGRILVERYRKQLLYYREALERLTGKRVKKMYLYSFFLGKALECG